VCGCSMMGAAGDRAAGILAGAGRASGAGSVAVCLGRGWVGGAGQDCGARIRDLGVRVLPNTAGCHRSKEAVTTARMAREVFDTPWIKLEIVGDPDSLQPDIFGLVKAASSLTEDGFQVFPYMTEDPILAERLLDAGCEVLMPWGAPIGSGLGLNNVYGLRALRARFPDVPMVVDAGLGVPSHAARAMELGMDAVLLNTAVAQAGDPVAMARAFALAVEAGKGAHGADPMDARDMAVPSTPILGKAFLE